MGGGSGGPFGGGGIRRLCLNGVRASGWSSGLSSGSRGRLLSRGGEGGRGGGGS